MDWTTVVGRPGDGPDDPPAVLVMANAVSMTVEQGRAAAAALSAAADALEAVEVSR